MPATGRTPVHKIFTAETATFWCRLVQDADIGAAVLGKDGAARTWDVARLDAAKRFLAAEWGDRSRRTATEETDDGTMAIVSPIKNRSTPRL